jgi:hypothetical protein
MSPLLNVVTMSRRSSTHRAYCRSANACFAAGVIVTSHAPSFTGLSLIRK